MGYLGNQSTFTGTQNNKRISSIATGGQTLFTVAGGYNINQIDVYRNGVKLVVSRDFTALDGTSVTLVSSASSGDILEFVVFENFLVADALTGDGDQSINGNLVVSGTISGTATSAESLSAGATGSDLNLSGIVTAIQFAGNIAGTAATFTGDISAASFIDADGNIKGVGIATAGGTVGTGVTLLDFRNSGVSTVTVSSGIATIQITGGGGAAGFNGVNFIMG